MASTPIARSVSRPARSKSRLALARPLALAVTLLAALGVALFAISPAQAESPVLENTDDGRTDDRPRAQSFTTGPEGVTLEQVRMRGGLDLIGDLTLEVRLDDGEHGPGTVLTTMERLPVAHDGLGGTKYFVNGPALEPNTTYWIVINAHSLADDDASERRLYGLGEGSQSSHGWKFGRTRYWNDENGRWEASNLSPWLVLIPDMSPVTVAPPPPPPAAAPQVDTRSAACQARHRALQQRFPGATVIAHCR